MHLLPRRLAPRLILGTTFLVAVGCTVSALLSVRMLEEQLVEEKITAADQLSRSITSAAWHAMRAGRKQDAYDVMATMGEQQGLEYIRMFAKSGTKAFSTDDQAPSSVGLDHDTCRVCHGQEPVRESVSREERIRYFRGEDGQRRMAILTPVYNEPACSTAECHAHAPTSPVLGVLDLAVTLERVDEELRSLQFQSFLVTFLKVVLIALFITFFVQRFVGRPIGRLIRGAKAVGRMDLDEEVVSDGETELGELAHSFNAMRIHLAEAQRENARFTVGLEREVEERTRELEAAQEKLIRSDRLASLGRLSASVAHEVNNPLSAVLNLSIYLQRLLEDGVLPPERVQAFRRHLGQIADETERAGRIVRDLLAFSRRSTPQREPADLNEVVQRTISLVRHRAELKNVELHLALRPDLPLVPCEKSHVQQVLLNLLLNALEALGPDGGTIHVRTDVEDAAASAILQVADDGPGIQAEHLARIFDPFFTTKEGEKGVGLGLSVAYGIAEAHGGRLDVDSAVGRGTTFTVRLPLTPDDVAREEGP